MDAIAGYLSAHPIVFVIGVIFIVILILHFIFKSFIKLVLIIFFILMLAFAHDYFKDPATLSKKIKESVEVGKSFISDLADKSKSLYKDSKELYKEGREAPGDINKLLKDSNKEVNKELKK
jgi:hypothetical protein